MATAELVALIKADDRASSALKGLQGRIQGMSAQLRKAGVAAGVVGGTIVAGMGMAVKSAAAFEAGMREVNSMMGLGQVEFEDFSAQVLKMSSTLGVDAVGATKALYQAISAGVPKENAIEFLTIASKAAIAGVTDTETAVDGLTTVINAFKMNTDDAGKVADIMFQTVKGGKTTFEELSASLFNVAPIAKASGVSFEEVSAALATLTKQGVPTSVATTQLRAAIQAVTAPTVRQIAALEEMGITMNRANLESKGLAGVFQELTDATQGDMSMMRRLVGSVEGVQAILAMTGDNAQTYAADLEAVKNATEGAGAASDAYNEINRGASRQLEIAREKLKAVGVAIGTQLLPQLIPLAEQLAAVINKVVAWMEANPKLTKNILMATAAIGGLLLVLAPILMMLPGIVAAFGLLLSPVGLVIAAIVALIAVGVLIYKNWETIKHGATVAWRAILSVVETSIRGIVGWINKLIEVMNKIPGVDIGRVNFGGFETLNKARQGAALANLEGFAGGGIVPGSIGQAVPILAHAGERVSTPGQSRGGGDVYVTVNVAGSVQAQHDLAETIRAELLRSKSRNYTSGL